MAHPPSTNPHPPRDRLLTLPQELRNAISTNSFITQEARISKIPHTNAEAGFSPLESLPAMCHVYKDAISEYLRTTTFVLAAHSVEKFTSFIGALPVETPFKSIRSLKISDLEYSASGPDPPKPTILPTVLTRCALGGLEVCMSIDMKTVSPPSEERVEAVLERWWVSVLAQMKELREVKIRITVYVGRQSGVQYDDRSLENFLVERLGGKKLRVEVETGVVRVVAVRECRRW